MGRNSVPVSMPVLWPCTSPICFHKTHKDSHGPFKKDGETHSDLNDMLIICRTREETIALRDTVILLLQCLGFVINQKKPVMTPVQETSENDSQFKGNYFFPSTEIPQMCQDLYQSPKTTVLELTKVLGLLTSIIHCPFLQQQQI